MSIKRTVSVILSVILLLQAVPAVQAEPVSSAAYETVQAEHGTTLRDQVIAGNLVMDDREPLYVDGTLTLNGGDIIVTGGQHTISRDAVIRGSVVVKGPAELFIDGILEGDLRLEWDCWPEDDARWGQENPVSDLHVVSRRHHGAVRRAEGTL